MPTGIPKWSPRMTNRRDLWRQHACAADRHRPRQPQPQPRETSCMGALMIGRAMHVVQVVNNARTSKVRLHEPHTLRL